MTTPPVSKQPVHRNETFVCDKCGKRIPPAKTGCRNHCTHCLYSKHVDRDTPGDRLSPCGGLMEPSAIIEKSGKGRQIIHKCLKCGKKESNIVAPDDDIEAIINIMRRQNTNFIPEQ